jgi:hypothetical protein
MSNASPVELAQSAYTAYGAATDHRNYQGLPMPEWNELGDTIQKAWIAASGDIVLGVLGSLAGGHVLTPDVGDVVLVPMDPAANNGADVAPAVITRVWSSTTVNARVLADGDVLPWRTSLVYSDTLDDVSASAPVWTWPPRS